MTLLTRLRRAASGFVEGSFEALVEGVRVLFGDSAAREQAAFAAGLVALSAKMARADGVVVASEVAAFRALCAVPERDERKLARLFDFAKSSTAGFEFYARQLARAYEDRPEVLEDVLDGLFFIAKADGAVHERELAYLAAVAQIFGFDEPAFARIRARHVRPPKDDPYAVLGLEPGASGAEVKRRYRQLVFEHHPDRLIARGLSAAAIKLATDRLAAINAAYDAIAGMRGL
jgi:DnaJ like chaperone protein